MDRTDKLQGGPGGRVPIGEVGPAFARNARTRRQVLGLSQADVSLVLLGHGIDWHQTTVAKVEKGERQVKLDEAYALADVYAIPLDDLVEGRGLLVVDRVRLVPQAEGGSVLREVRETLEDRSGEDKDL